jgi:hypothetical protein
MKQPAGHLKVLIWFHTGLLYPEYLLAAVSSTRTVVQVPADTARVEFDFPSLLNQLDIGSETLELVHIPTGWTAFHDDKIPFRLHIFGFRIQ